MADEAKGPPRIMKYQPALESVSCLRLWPAAGLLLSGLLSIVGAHCDLLNVVATGHNEQWCPLALL